MMNDFDDLLDQFRATLINLRTVQSIVICSDRELLCSSNRSRVLEIVQQLDIALIELKASINNY